MTTVRFAALAAVCMFVLGIGAQVSAAPPPLEAYGRLAHVEHMRLSPSGDRYAFVRIIDGARQLVVVPVAGGKPMALNFSLTDKVRDVEWAGDDHVMVVVSGTTHTAGLFTVDAFETSEVLVLPLNGARSFVVFEGHQDVVPMVTGRFGEASIDGHWYGYFGAITLTKTMTGTTMDHGYTDLYRVDMDTGATLLVSKGGINIDIGGWLLSPDGKLIARSSYFQRTGAWQVNAAAGDLILSGHSLIDGAELAGFGRTPDTVLVRMPDLPTPTYQTASIANGSTQPVTDGARIIEPLFDRRTHLWIGEILGGDTPQAVFFSPQIQSRMNGARKAFANYNVQLVSYDGDFNRFIIYTDGGDDSGTYWLVDIGKHSVESVGQAFPDVKETDVGPFRKVNWKAADGLAMEGVLTLPPGRAATLSSSRISAARTVMARDLSMPATANGAARCRPTSLTASPSWPTRESSTLNEPASLAPATAAMLR